jgi:IS5 family transposase
MQALQRMTPAQRKTRQRQKYRELIGIAEEVVESARHGLRDTHKVCLIDPAAQSAAEELRRQIDHYCGLGERVIDQARRRVLLGEQVATAEKVYSIFEPHTDLIKRGKVLTPVEFGHKVFLAESAQGLITQYNVLTGNPRDADHVEASLSRHQAMFGSAPQVYSSDRGFFSEENLAACRRSGVEMACIPQSGGTKSAEREAHEKSPVFKKAQRFRAGIEGRISVLFRGRGMKRCLAEGRERFELLIGAAVLANNLLTIASLMQKRSTGRRHAA